MYVVLCMGTPKGKRRDFEALEKRRFEAMRRLDQGLNQSETARRLKVARQTVSEWRRRYRAQGEAGLRATRFDQLSLRIAGRRGAGKLDYELQFGQAL